MSVSTRIHCLVVRASLFLMAAALVGLSPLMAADRACVDAEPITINSTVRMERLDTEKPDLLRLTFPTAGMFAMHASSAATEETAPRITFLGDSCTNDGRGYSIIRETPIDLVLKVTTPGDHYLVVGPEDPAANLSSYRLLTAFAPDPVVPDEVVTFDVDPPSSCAAENLPSFTSEPLAEDRYVELHRDTNQTKDVDPVECDISGGESSTSGILVIESMDPLLATIYGDATCDTNGRMAEGTLGGEGAFVATAMYPGDFRLDLQRYQGSPYTVGIKYFALCNRGEHDDHSDVPLCGTQLDAGEDKAGLLDENWQGDEDFFTFAVATPEIIRINVRSPRPVSVSLYDGQGQHLKSWKTCAERGRGNPLGCKLRMVRALGEGRFFLRVTGDDGSVQPYSVNWSQLVDRNHPVS